MKNFFFYSAIFVAVFCSSTAFSSETKSQPSLCLDDFCIGQSILDKRFNEVEWIIPKDVSKKNCTGIGCRPDVAFSGYSKEAQTNLAEAFTYVYGLPDYNILTKSNLEILKQYKYDCNASARGIFGERRIIGIYKSNPSQYATIVGLRLIDDELKVYRIAREYPFRNKNELISLAKTLHDEYGEGILFYEYLSSNAYSDVIKQSKNGWFARSSTFNPTDSSDNLAELVLIDPKTRPLLQATSMPDSGEIKPLAVVQSQHCNRSLPIQ